MAWWLASGRLVLESWDMPMERRESETMAACCGRNRARERKREKKMDHWQVISLIDQSIRVYGQVKKTHSEKNIFFLLP